MWVCTNSCILSLVYHKNAYSIFTIVWGTKTLLSAEHSYFPLPRKVVFSSAHIVIFNRSILL